MTEKGRGFHYNIKEEKAKKVV